MEWILNGFPNLSDPSILPRMTRDGNHAVFTFSRRDDSESLGQLIAQWSHTLDDWKDVIIQASSSGPDADGVTVSVLEDDDAPDTIVVRVPNSHSAERQLFIRLRSMTP